ncbi:hypothetical protein THOM_2828 [Trachipleistophora hominis]|uniref:Uncharacterized protein n=1 Tax=Trachipleistophora hominis TaxID=72359 RepID=L7JT91_TRAHO|nr:hypothetical protein THOM_2828 [Trachipleistophora hominis]
MEDDRHVLSTVRMLVGVPLQS